MHEPVDAVKIVLIGGPSGAGKTCLAGELHARMGPDAITALSMDDYYHDLRETAEHERAVQNFDHPDALDWELLAAHVRALAGGGGVEKPVYDFASHTRRAETDAVSASEVLLIDGIHALTRDTLTSFARLTVYVDAPREVCLERRLARDVAERGRDRASVLRQFEESVWPMAERFVLPARDRADLVVPYGTPLEESAEWVLKRLLEAI